MAETSIESGRPAALLPGADPAGTEDVDLLAAQCFWWDPCILPRRSR